MPPATTPLRSPTTGAVESRIERTRREAEAEDYKVPNSDALEPPPRTSTPDQRLLDRRLLHRRGLQLATLSIIYYADFAEHEGPSKSSTEDTYRGTPRGTNHSTRKATSDTRREQKAQVGRQKASAITGSTGLRRRERRFESCRGHFRKQSAMSREHRHNPEPSPVRGFCL